MLFFETIEPATLDLLRRLQAVLELSETRLVGGTALALQIGHRISADLDVFGAWDYNLDLTETLQDVGDVQKDSGTPNGRMAFFHIDGVKVDCVAYDMYGWLEPPVEEAGLRLASIRDIAAMKINAITNRGSRKDFVDLAFLLARHSLSEMFGWYLAKYRGVNPALAMRSLVYFADAETMPMPRMLAQFDWEVAKDQMRNAVRELVS